MRIRRFSGSNTSEAMRRVRKAMGPDAVILSTGRLADGKVEIAAAVDEKAPPQTGTPRPDQPVSLEGLAGQLSSLTKRLDRHMMVSEAAGSFSARPEMAPVFGHFSGQEVNPEIITGLLDGLYAKDGRGILPNISIRLKKMLSVAGPPRITTKGPTIWALVGPTGVGKTTTAAKLAAIFALKHRLNVGMITVDTFRMAAAEQLKVYGRIIDVPTYVAADAEQMEQAVRKLSSCDFIVVDTVGRAPGDGAALSEMKEVLDAAPGIASHLVLAATTREADQQKVVEGFSGFSPQSLIFTKLDETSVYGTILNRSVETGLDVSYLTTGQRVPDDLEEATREGLAKKLMPRADALGRC